MIGRIIKGFAILLLVFSFGFTELSAQKKKEIWENDYDLEYAKFQIFSSELIEIPSFYDFFSADKINSKKIIYADKIFTESNIAEKKIYKYDAFKFLTNEVSIKNRYGRLDTDETAYVYWKDNDIFYIYSICKDSITIYKFGNLNLVLEKKVFKNTTEVLVYTFIYDNNNQLKKIVSNTNDFDSVTFNTIKVEPHYNEIFNADIPEELIYLFKFPEVDFDVNLIEIRKFKHNILIESIYKHWFAISNSLYVQTRLNRESNSSWIRSSETTMSSFVIYEDGSRMSKSLKMLFTSFSSHNVERTSEYEKYVIGKDSIMHEAFNKSTLTTLSRYRIGKCKRENAIDSIPKFNNTVIYKKVFYAD